METGVQTIIMLTLALNAILVAIGIYCVMRLNAIKYLLEQPAVKKMGSEFKLKPVKLDGDGRRQASPSRSVSDSKPERLERPHRDRDYRDRDRNRDNRGRRPDRPNRSPRPNNRTGMMSNSAGEEKEKKENTEPNEYAGGRRPLNGDSSVPSKGAPEATTSTTESSAPTAPKTDSTPSYDSNEVKHGRRARFVKAPSFDE